MSQKGVTQAKILQERMTDNIKFEMNMLLGPTFLGLSFAKYVCHLHGWSPQF